MEVSSLDDDSKMFSGCVGIKNTEVEKYDIKQQS